METRREMENKKLEKPDETGLIKAGVALFKKYANTGHDVPAGEAEAFQKLTKESLTDLFPADEIDDEKKGAHRKRWTVKTEEGEFIEDARRFMDFRQTVGMAALLGKFKMAGRDVGADFMRLFFGDRDARIFQGVSLLTKETGYPLNRYSLTDMKNVYLLAANKIELGETFSADARGALSRLGSFLKAVGTDADRDQIFIEETVIGQVNLQKELEQKLGKGLTPEQVRAETVANQEELGRLWTGFKVASLEQAPDLVRRMLNLSAENITLKQFEESGVSGMSFSSVPSVLFANRARAGAYQRMATERLRRVEGLPPDSFEAQELTKWATKYEQAAAQLWQTGIPAQTDQQSPSEQEVAHD